MWVVCLSYWDPGENVGTETPDDDPRSDAVSCNHPGEALTCWKVITLTELCLCKWPCLLVANCPLVPPGRFHSLSPITDLSEIAGTLLVKARTDMYLTVWSCFVGVCVCLKKSSSLTHLLPSPFTELSSSRFIFVESKFRVLGEKKKQPRTHLRERLHHIFGTMWEQTHLSFSLALNAYIHHHFLVLHFCELRLIRHRLTISIPADRI